MRCLVTNLLHPTISIEMGTHFNHASSVIQLIEKELYIYPQPQDRITGFSWLAAEEECSITHYHQRTKIYCYN